MFKQVLSFAVLCAIISYISANQIESNDEGFLNINWDKVNPGCTIKCASYWTCYAKNFGNPSACESPAGCECNKFADDDEKKLDIKKGLEKLDRIVDKAQKVIDIYHEIRTLNENTAENDEGFLNINWDKVNPGCTIKCASYWTCYAKNFGNPSACESPAGCECNKFADDDEKKLDFKKILGNIDKGIDTYNKIRGIFSEEDELKLGKIFKKINKGVDTYNKIRGIFSEEDEYVRMPVLNDRKSKLLSQLKRGRRAIRRAHEVLSEDDDERVHFGRVLNKINRTIGRYNELHGPLSEEDELKLKKIVKGVKKVAKIANKVRGIAGPAALFLEE